MGKGAPLSGSQEGTGMAFLRHADWPLLLTWSAPCDPRSLPGSQTGLMGSDLTQDRLHNGARSQCLVRGVGRCYVAGSGPGVPEDRHDPDALVSLAAQGIVPCACLPMGKAERTGRVSIKAPWILLMSLSLQLHLSSRP